MTSDSNITARRTLLRLHLPLGYLGRNQTLTLSTCADSLA
jgi:hypothetical protein